MPKITELPALTVPSDSYPLAIVDTSGAITKKITRSDLLKGAALPTNTVTTAAITDGSVTLAKIDLLSFHSPLAVTGTNATAVTVATTLATSSYSITNGISYQLMFNASTGFVSASSTVWELRYIINGVTISTSRIEGTTQRGSHILGLYTASSTASVTFSIQAVRLTGSGALTVETPRMIAIPVIYST